LEAYYHSDPRIEEWVNEITEKIFTVCLLTGPDAEVEFQRGSQIVTNVTNLLQGISMFPVEYLEEGLKQLLEQQLPDSRVISNFPTFQATMNKMLRKGMLSAMATQSKEKMKNQVPSASNTYEKTKEDTEKDTFIDNELVKVALASVNSMTSKLLATEVELLPAPESEELIVTISDKQTKPYGMIRTTQVPEQADRLKHVLNTIFPNAAIVWNLNLMGQTFLAQVEDILICLHKPEQPCPVKNFNKEGWKVYVCTSNDLMFPRRLERGIRQIQRFGKGRNG